MHNVNTFEWLQAAKLLFSFAHCWHTWWYRKSSVIMRVELSVIWEMGNVFALHFHHMLHIRILLTFFEVEKSEAFHLMNIEYHFRSVSWSSDRMCNANWICWKYSCVIKLIISIMLLIIQHSFGRVLSMVHTELACRIDAVFTVSKHFLSRFHKMKLMQSK